MSSLLKHLNEVNNVPVTDVYEEKFATYGRVVEGFDFLELITYMEDYTGIPAEGNTYVPSVEKMEDKPVSIQVRDVLYGGKGVEVGYCNGRNSTYNGFEYHKSSEIDIAVTDLMLVLGHTWDIRDNHYDVKDAEVFFIEKGTAIEMYQTTLHLSPLKVTDDGFKCVVILPADTNTPLNDNEKNDRDRLIAGGCKEARLLLQRNKWVIAHPQRKQLTDQGAFPGVIGENKELFY